MGLLDDMPKSVDEFKQMLEGASGIMKAYYERHPGDEFEQKFRARIQAGESPAQIYGLERKHLDALLATGGRLLTIGKVEEARDWLMMLNILEPLEERATYMLGMAYQLSGDYSTAAKCYVNFLALDATNPEGHLRLAECFMASNERENAVSCVKTAAELCKAGHGTAGAKAHAARLGAVLAGEDAA